MDESDSMEMGIRRGDNDNWVTRHTGLKRHLRLRKILKAGSLHKQYLKDTTCLKSRRKKNGHSRIFSTKEKLV